MDVQLAGEMNGIEAAVAIRREFPRLPVVFYSIQDDDAYYRAFRRSGILSHYAYVRKSNYLLPAMILPLLRDAVAGRSFIDPDIEARVQEVRHKDDSRPMALLEPKEQEVARMLAQGLTNEQIAARLGFRDKRTISRTNGQIYAAWGLSETATDEKVARTRAAIVAASGRLIRWDEEGNAFVLDERDEWVAWTPDDMILTSLVTWALVAVSLFNTILLLWLGITLWLNANRRDLGVAVIAFGFLLGSAFFVAHAALLLSDTWQLTRSNTLWLAVAMTPITLLPYVWYVVLLRYCGYWVDEDRQPAPAPPSLGCADGARPADRPRLPGAAGYTYVPVLRLLTPWVWSLRELVKTASSVSRW